MVSKMKIAEDGRCRSHRSQVTGHRSQVKNYAPPGESTEKVLNVPFPVVRSAYVHANVYGNSYVIK